MTYVCLLNNAAEETIKGNTVITDYQSLYQAIIKKDCRELIIKDDFATKYFTPSGLSQFIEDCKALNPLCHIKVNKDLAKSFESDVELLLNLKDPEDLINLLLNNREDVFSLIKDIASTYYKKYSEALLANNKLSTMHLELSEYARSKDIEVDKRRKVTEQSNILHTKLDTLISRIKYTYNKDIDIEHLLGYDIDITNFKHIIYIKEITRVRYIDTLLYYLKEIMKIVNNVPVRFLVIEPPYADSKIHLYPNCVPYTDLTFKDVYNSDIFMAGFQQKLVGDILHNTSNFPYIIVLDRTGTEKAYIRGSSVITYYTLSDIKDSEVPLPSNRIISYKKSFLHIPYANGFDKLTSEEKISIYSSFPIVKTILEDVL